MSEVDNYFKSKGLHENKPNGEGEDNEYVKWKRWEWYMRDRLGPNGEFVNISEKIKEANVFRNSSNASIAYSNAPSSVNNTSTGAWGFVGPNSYGTVWGSLPGNGRVDRVAFHPTNANIIFAATPGGGLWKTTDGGTNWSSLSNFMPTMGISGIVIDRLNSNIIYVLTGTGDDYNPGYFVYDFGYSRAAVGVLKSLDGGVNWSTTGALYTGGPYAGFKLVQDPRNTNILLAATNHGLYRTTNGGVTWVQVLSGVYYDVEFNPVSSVSSNSAYVTGPGTYYHSTNEGLSWSLGTFNVALYPTGRNAIAVTANDTNKVYVLSGPVTANSCSPVINPGFWGVYHSGDGGKTFVVGKRTPNILGADDAGNSCEDQTGYDIGISAAPSNANFIAMCGMTIWTSIDQGISSLTHVTYYWGGPTNNVHPDVHGVDYNPLDGKLYACTDGGLYVSPNNGNNWSYISNGINASQWYHFNGAVNDNTHLGGGLQDNGIRNRTTSTPSFNHVASGDGFDCAYDPNNSSRFYTIINTGGNLYTADGANFVYGSNFTSYFPKIGRHPTNTNTLFVGREDAVFESTNEGGNYTSNTSAGGNRRIVFCPSLTSTVYAANSSAVFRNASNGVGTWTNLASSPGWPAGSPVVTCIAVNPLNSNIVAVTFGGFSATAKVLYSVDGGANWANESYNLPNLPVNCVVFNNDNSIYVGTDDGIYYQSPTDVNWLPFYNFLPRVPITDLQIFQTAQSIFASTFGRGIWASTLKQACDVNLSVGGLVGGQLFNQASNSVTSTQILTGGAGTQVYNRGGNFVTLGVGFEAKSGNEFKAYIGPCDQHGVPIFAPAFNPGAIKTTLVVPNYNLPYDSLKKTNLPYGYIFVKKVSATTGQVQLTTKETKIYSLRIVNSTRELLTEVYKSQLGAGNRDLTFMYPALTPGLYYLEMLVGDKLAHFQEWRVQ